MAESVHLYLKANGTDIKGDSTQTSLGRADSIECVSYSQKVFTARESGSGLATGRRQYEGIEITKRIDKSSPLLMKALCENQVIDATFKFFRPNPTGDGTTEQFYTVEIKKARINAIQQTVPNAFVPASSNSPPLENISIVFHSISWTITQGGVTHLDTWDAQR
ncbi:Secreted protein Hcp [Myxococcus hansupus]|uniref:Secreted protein Hcp n=1 Tax=Pseudomyxococcus hansupus TaxID=1297742 RepID=A0A0H4WQY7_9BACT|nr:type VI secretion system tube protein TssD [Myxococcus hansupus]AKQ65169.1 Secreted protein Hcp [Myxococcus hansupus]